MHLVGFTTERVLFVYCLQTLILVLSSSLINVKQQNVLWHKPINISEEPTAFNFGVKVFSLFHPEDLGSWFLQNVCKFPPDYMVSHTRCY